MDYAFVKGHGTENDFVLIPDANGRHELSAEQVARLCDRRAGIGADGVIRVVRTDATDDPAAVAARGAARWFMDYRNSDGSLSEMCGNGIRVLGLYLATHADVDVREPLPIATRAGVKTLTFDGADRITVDMGAPEVLGETKVSVGERFWTASRISMGNPHAVAFVDSLDEAIAHVNDHSTGHSEAIVTGDLVNAERFLAEVDAAAVLVNASTRFVDGEEFGFGAEIGISTQKLHARGPMGLTQLTTAKYVVRGDGQTRG